ncbi:alcohol dehydrogenase catalytic domain-containing protein [Microbacterium sp. ASV81]|uniref:alcohol dehydrogenase n=1 Tax=Microbacterium capsulatum TaxID=3041921 RepID=A0ABU0XPH2_9MICO|nr:alcohol dehydrogenase catalytic domain-containing protein [Microbacterium sp. ASV81]MDQ4215660.1 alcohol dehydrogenase catalytic domain-containing protein [Microbacterium sp. ASV81]
MRAALIPPAHPVHRHDVPLRPAATAMAWLGAGMPHQALAVPGVALAPKDVLVAVEMSTICGSDIHTVQGRRHAPTPLVLGHESVGRIIAIGDDGAGAVDGSELHVGDRVVWSVTVSCGDCDRCRAGLTQKCRTLAKYGHARIEPRWELTGGFAGHVHLRGGTAIVRVPEALPAAALAPVSCATATAWAAVVRAAALRGRLLSQPTALAGERVVVFGAGLVGLTAAAIAASHGATAVVADPNQGRRAFAARFGLTAVDPDAVATESADIVVEASGHAVPAALDAADVGGAAILVGSVFPADPVPLDAERIVRRLIAVAGVHNYTGAQLHAAAAFMAGSGRAYPFADAVGAVHPLAQVDAALAEASGPDAPLRVGLTPR